MPRQRKPVGSPPDTDAIQRDLARLLAKQEFASVDDVNAFLQQFTQQPLPVVPPANDRERAEDLVMTARAERSATRRRRMLADALAMDPDCVSAHVALADESTSPVEAITHARNAVAAGERALGETASDPESFLWGDPVGRQWLIARSLLSQLLWQRGDRQEAIAEAREVLRLNAGDNQGVRYSLLEMLMLAGSTADVDTLLNAYDERSTHWLFARALHEFRRHGPTGAAKRAAQAAHRANRHVAPILLGQLEMPEDEPMTYSPGDVDEAALYVTAALPAWIDADTALDWLASVVPSR